jgi:hypothetical protein
MGARRRRDGLAARITAEAARLAMDDLHGDLAAIRRKAALGLGCTDQRAWPDLAEVEEAVRVQQRLFRGPEQSAALARLRELAVEAMDMLAAFSPRLTGPVLEGTADEHTPVRLLLQADSPEEVIFALTDRRIPWKAEDVRLYFGKGRFETRPRLSFEAGDTRVELVVLGEADRGRPPMEPERERPVPAASLEQFKQVLAERTGPRA